MTKIKYMQKGFLPVVWLFTVAVVVVIGFFVYQNYFKKQASEETTYLQEKYENPFEEQSQYENPFEESKYTNPFENLE